MMKKLLVITLALVFVIGSASMVFAGFEDSNMEKGLDKSPTFKEGTHSWVHENGAPRFDTDNGRIAIEPKEPGENSDEDSQVISHGDDSLIKTDQSDDFGE